MVKRSRYSRLVAALTVIVLCGTGRVLAQGGAPQGLFGNSGRPDASATTRLDVAATVVEGYDSDVPQSLLQTIDPSALQSGGFSTMVNGNLAYSKKVASAEFGASLSSTVRYYADLGQARSAGHSAGVGAEFRLPSRMTWLINQTATYAPAYLYGLFPTSVSLDSGPGSQGDSALDYSLSDFNSYVHTTSTKLTHKLTQRSAISGSGDFIYTDRQRATVEWRDLSAYALRAEYSRNVSRNLSLKARTQYRFGEWGYLASGRIKELRLDGGVSYVHPLSPTRKAAFHINVGSSAADIPQVLVGFQPIERQYLGVADGGFDYQFSRGWQVHGSFKRGLEYLVDLPEPVFADSYGGSIEGILSRRIDIQAYAGYSSGASLLHQTSMLFDTYTGNVRARFALSRTTALYGEYLYYYYDFRNGQQLRPGMPLGLERNGIRVGLTLWVPALRE